MTCDQCGPLIAQGEERAHLGRTLCEDCYMDVLSPQRACDPWAVHSAKSFENHSGGLETLTLLQNTILQILRETGGVAPSTLLKRLDGKTTMKDLEREFAVLRHMEKKGWRNAGRKWSGAFGDRGIPVL
ncbi:MAG: hypothetical protein JRG88_00930 [Deltaproteobacteria bacterium]|nr:hypothetical protein [Deltaproteobacteria bacterium]